MREFFSISHKTKCKIRMFVLLDRAEELIVKEQRENEGKYLEVHVNQLNLSLSP